MNVNEEGGFNLGVGEGRMGEECGWKLFVYVEDVWVEGRGMEMNVLYLS